jgi:hypothetical protein
MNAHWDYDTKTLTHNVYPISVKGPTRSGCEERLAELVQRYESLTEQLRTIDPEGLLTGC